MVRMSVLNDALKNLTNAERRGKRQVSWACSISAIRHVGLAYRKRCSASLSSHACGMSSDVSCIAVPSPPQLQGHCQVPPSHAKARYASPLPM